jgi:general secretion pathway protein L
MPDTFVLRYPAPGAGHEGAQWLCVDASGGRVGPVGQGTLATAAEAAGSRRLVVLVPGEEVTLAAPELPAKSAAKLAQLARYALEEQLASDIESLHFAYGRQQPDRRVPVAVVDRERIAGWLARLAAAGLAPSALVPDTLAIPENPAHVVVLIEAGRVYVRRPGALPLVLDSAPLEAALAAAGLPAPPGEMAAPRDVLLYATPAEWEQHRSVIEALHGQVASLKVQLLAEGALPWLAPAAVTAAPLSLLQGEFQVRHGLAQQWPRWRFTAALAGALLVLHLATLGLDWWRVQRAERELDARLRASAAEALPGISNLDRLPSVRAAVEGRLHAGRAAVSEGLLGALGVVGSALAAAPGTQVESLNFHEGVTDLTLDAADISAIDRVQQAARSRGYGAELQGATPREQRTVGRLQLRGPGR